MKVTDFPLKIDWQLGHMMGPLHQTPTTHLGGMGAVSKIGTLVVERWNNYLITSSGIKHWLQNKQELQTLIFSIKDLPSYVHEYWWNRSQVNATECLW